MLTLIILSVTMQNLSFDSNGQIFIWTEKMERDLPLFPEYKNFIDARILKRGD